MSSPKLRHSARAIILDEQDNVLLCRAMTPDGFHVWITPGGGLEEGETPVEALARELIEEVGFRFEAQPPQIWRQEIIEPGHVAGFDGVLADYFLIRSKAFTPLGQLSTSELACENLIGFRWWSLTDLQTYSGPDLIAPRSLATELSNLLARGPSPTIVDLS